ncbi:hypothetical protein VKT23_001924 [Stygiomarasmius scandens]|uniref:Uncharacterized protein n=1 Tax=Marasmiellus scandens TaxID=2682957 RepID=A0ABR1K0U5_9AGAR
MPFNDAQITYDPQDKWWPSHRFPGAHWTNHRGSTATCIFNGTQVDVFGVQSGRTNFMLDSNSYPGRLNNQPFQNNTNTLFSSSLQNDHEHTLVITFQSSGFVVLDIVVSDSPHTSLSDLPPTSTFTSQATVSSLPHLSPSPTNNLGTSSKANDIGEIVGGVIAGLVALASLIAFVLYRRRKRIQVARRTSPYAVTPFVTEYSKSSSPEPIKNMRTSDIAPIPTLSFSSEMGHQDETPPAFIAGASNLGRHGSMYKPRQSVESLPPTEFGYGGGLSREEWSRYTLKSKS